MTDAILLRRRFLIGERAFTVLGEPWFDADGDAWRARLLFVPLDHSLPHGIASAPVKRADRRDDLLRQLGQVTDRDLERAFRAIALPLPGGRTTPPSRER